MNFYETKAGHRFFEHQLPLLTATVQELVRTLQKTPPVLQIPVEVSPNFLKDLYYGNYELDAVKDKEKTVEYNKAIIEIQQHLKELASSQLWDYIEKYRDTLDARSCYEAEQAFEAGFGTAVKMITSGLTIQPYTVTGKEQV